ncbi:hypothetical protein HD806DRAFT_280857 [Xylariaceae sp. AK1471]|nr:hypothetical protein HD806DRAFT_280857 [Xylariaceae sp. AK1471]
MMLSLSVNLVSHHVTSSLAVWCVLYLGSIELAGWCPTNSPIFLKSDMPHLNLGASYPVLRLADTTSSLPTNNNNHRPNSE